MTSFDYAATFGNDTRLLRGQILGSILSLSLYDIPAYRDSWCERWQNPDREPGVGPLIIAIYTESNGKHRDPLASKIFTLRAHEMYDHERDDEVATDYTTFYFRIPADTPQDIIGTMAARAVDPVDTDLRWTTALGITKGGNS